MSLKSTPVRFEPTDQAFTVSDFSNLYTATLMDRQSTEYTAPQQAADFFTGLCALKPSWRNRYLANAGYQGIDSVHLHGEYGYVYIVNMGLEQPAALMISISWCVGGDTPNLFRRAIGLLRECMRLQLPADTLIQWFDTMSRFRNGKRTSPHFDPENALNKIAHRIQPMIQLMNERNESFTQAFQMYVKRELK